MSQTEKAGYVPNAIELVSKMDKKNKQEYAKGNVKIRFKRRGREVKSHFLFEVRMLKEL